MDHNKFLALQCCECSTMQVKQRKKSSNKWLCVVCNQKQSVLKIFAQGPMAKDLRNFVQSFNMSRKFAADQIQNQPFDPALEYDINFEEDDDDPQNQKKKRRYDWTEYLDHNDKKLVLQEEEKGEITPKFVTELPPWEKFKRPKLTNYETKGGGDHQLYKPVFSRRNNRREDTLLTSKDEKPMMRQQQAMGEIGRTSASELRDIPIGMGGKSMRDCNLATVKRKDSKWKDYITEDDHESFRNFANHRNEWCDSVFETESKYQMVEDDIHQDFI